MVASLNALMATAHAHAFAHLLAVVDTHATNSKQLSHEGTRVLRQLSNQPVL